MSLGRTSNNSFLNLASHVMTTRIPILNTLSQNPVYQNRQAQTQDSLVTLPIDRMILIHNLLAIDTLLKKAIVLTDENKRLIGRHPS